MKRNRYTRKKFNWRRRRPERALPLALPARSAEPEADRGHPFAGRAWIRLGLLGLLAAGAVYLSLVSVNILVLGTDDVDYSQHTDTILLLHWRPLPRRLALLSVPRDTLIALPKRGPLKLNAVYAYGKALNGPAYALAMTRASIENLLGVRIHYLVHIRYSGFITLVDAVGGVPIYVAKHMRYTDQAGGLHIDLAPGYQMLDGRQSLDYVRFRHDEEGDLGRMRRQQEFVKAFVSQLAGISRLPRTLRAFYTFLHQVETDLTPPPALFLAWELKGIAGLNWRRAILPGKPVYLEGKAYWQTDPAEVKSFMAELGRTPQARRAPAEAAVAAATAMPAGTPAEAAVAAPTVMPAGPSAKAAVAPPAPTAAPTVAPHKLPRRPAEPAVPLAEPRLHRTPPPLAVGLPSGSQPVVRILNGCGVDGVCKRAAERLARHRLHIEPRDVTNAPAFNFRVTIVKTTSKNLPWARGIAKMLGLGEDRIQVVPANIKYPSVTVVVGADYPEWLR